MKKKTLPVQNTVKGNEEALKLIERLCLLPGTLGLVEGGAPSLEAVYTKKDKIETQHLSFSVHVQVPHLMFLTPFVFESVHRSLGPRPCL